jgi:hypothetical protein
MPGDGGRVQKIWTISATLAALLFSTALPARAETYALRLGLEAPLYTHVSTGASTSYTIGDTLQPAVDVLLSYKPFPLVAFEAELREGFASTGSGYKRTGTAIGPGLRISLPILPLYARASLPVHVEPSPVFVGFRAAGGLEFSLVVVSLYIEAAVDFSLAGGNIATGPTTSSNIGPFDLTSVSGGTGLWFKF